MIRIRGAVVGAVLAALGSLWSGSGVVLAGEDEAATIARGGRLYEDWAKEIGADNLRKAERSQEQAGARPGRCVDCHGWDYRGKEGAGQRVGQAGLAAGIDRKVGADTGEIEIGRAHV
jgi:hypothetical protein